MRKQVVEQLGEKLRRALESGHFEVALPLIDEYGKAALQAMRVARDDRTRTNILNETSSFLQERLHLARVLRSHLSAQVRASSRLISYESMACTKSTWKVDA
jgi:hypothetical protein